eukprot:1154925-Pelagomonas_calceolata.AAC.13
MAAHKQEKQGNLGQACSCAHHACCMQGKQLDVIILSCVRATPSVAALEPATVIPWNRKSTGSGPLRSVNLSSSFVDLGPGKSCARHRLCLIRVDKMYSVYMYTLCKTHHSMHGVVDARLMNGKSEMILLSEEQL